MDPVFYEDSSNDTTINALRQGINPDVYNEDSTPAKPKTADNTDTNKNSKKKDKEKNVTTTNDSQEKLITNVIFENPLHTSAQVFDIINKYRGTLQYTIAIGQGPPNEKTGSDDNGTKTTGVNRILYDTIGAPSLFNPYYGVQAVGITPGIPLLDTQQNKDSVSAVASTGPDEKGNNIVKTGQIRLPEINDCSIANLVKLSKMSNSRLGHAKYKYTDFMYCAEVGKISNNHLITLRKFNTPVGDNIFEETAIEDKLSNLQIYSDVGRMVTWFGTEDNKLEDILRYSFNSTWKHLDAKIDSQDSQETDSERGVMGGLVNLFSKDYNKSVARGVAPSALSMLLDSGGSDALLSSKPYVSNPAVNGSKYDDNRVYEPQDTIRSVEIPEGKLDFSHEFTLVFNYKLRGYDNINAKSAMLDLLANILAVTYRQGTFWQGEQRIIGAPPSPAGWQKVESFKKDAFNAGGTFIEKLLNGGNIGDAASVLINSLSSAVSSNFGIDLAGLIKNPKGALDKLLDTARSAGFGDMLKGMASNAMGRPAIYAFDSLLSGDNTGLWHVTIGNPLNPIAVIGNLILTNAEITHNGPLGLDDFPTDLRVTVTLKHARPRDSVDIQRMYTMGRTAIYGKIGNTKNYILSGFNNVAKTTNNNSKQVNSTKVETTTNTAETTVITTNKVENKYNEVIGWLGESSSERFIGNLSRLK